MKSKLMSVVEEQIAVQFTGRVNVLSTFNRQYLGHILFKSGEVIHATFQQMQGLKAFYHLIIQEYSLQSFDYVVEPEVVDENERKIHYPFAVIRNKLADVLKNYKKSVSLRPPENVRILLSSKILEDSTPV